MFSYLQITVSRGISHKIVTEPNSFWWNFSKDFLLPLFLAGLAAAAAYWIFVKETLREKEKEEKVKLKEELDRLTFFSAIVENALITSAIQAKNIATQISAIQQDPIEFHLMEQVPLNDLKRITETLNLENYLLAYTHYYSIDREALSKEFQKIIASCDFLYNVFLQIIEQLSKAQGFDNERKKQFANSFTKAQNLLGKLVQLLFENDKKSYQTMLSLMNNFGDNHPKGGNRITYYNESFFIPFGKFCDDYFASMQNPIPEMLELAILSRDGQQIYKSIIRQNQSVMSDLEEDVKTIEGSIAAFRENSDRLIKSFK